MLFQKSSNQVFILLLCIFCVISLLIAPPLLARDQEMSSGDADQRKAFYDNVSTFGANTRLVGKAIDMGDFSGDGKDDIAVSAPFSQDPGGINNQEGVVFYHPGPIVKDISSTYDLANYPVIDDGGYILGRYAQDHLGFAMSFGDTNGDGTADLVMASASHSGGTGEVYVLWGGGTYINPAAPTYKQRLRLNENIGEIDLLVENIPGAGFDGTDTTGITLVVGDITGDSSDDIIIGAPHYNSNRGAVFIVFGTGASTTVDATTPDGVKFVRIDGAAAGDKLGSSLAVGDVCGTDSRLDLIIGAPGANSSQGKVYVLQGKTSSNYTFGGDYILNIATEIAELASTISGTNGGDEFGNAVGSGNINAATGHDDIIVGAWKGGTNNAGEILAFIGQNTLSSSMTSGDTDFHILSAYETELLGSSIHVADFNGDSIDDVLFGSRQGKDVANVNVVGRAYLVLGATSLPTTFNLATLGNWQDSLVMYGEITGGAFGSAVSSGFLSDRSSRDILVADQLKYTAGQLSDTGVVYNIYYTRGPNAPTAITSFTSPSNNASKTVNWTHDDPELLPQIQYQVQFAKDSGYTTGLVDSGETTSAASSWAATLNQGDGLYYYHVRTANSYNFGFYSTSQTVYLDTGSPVASESTTWDYKQLVTM
jgi:hypothetical protein